ncbi:MAG: hypothetical protein PUE08_02395 [Eubacteriales bacterium]|nr:hypothetical protein [Eubacteriales bacterium]
MTVTIKYPADYSVELFSADGMQEDKKIDTNSDSKYTVTTYELPASDKIILKTTYKKKFPFKYTLFKNNWFAYAFSSVVSFDFWLPEQTIIIDMKARETTQLNILLSYDYVKSTMNGCINRLKAEFPVTKKAYLKSVTEEETSKHIKNTLKFSLVLGLIFNIFVYALLISLFVLFILEIPFPPFFKNTVLDILVIILLSILCMIYIARFIISYKDMINFV